MITAARLFTKMTLLKLVEREQWYVMHKLKSLKELEQVWKRERKNKGCKRIALRKASLNACSQHPSKTR
jgi:hypothetical protein